MPLNSEEKRHEDYVNSTLDRVNKKYHCNIVHVHDIQEIEQYIAEHPTEQKIGFLLQAPDYINQPYHYSPIYFERVGTVEHFAQFDSTQAVPYILPESKNPDIHRKQYYSPFSRQVAEEGCLEDAVNILAKCFQEKSFLNFCESSSVKDVDIVVQTAEEAEQFSVLSKIKYKSKEQKAALICVQPKEIYKLGKQILLENEQIPIQNLQKLTSLPARFLTNIENYSTMRYFLEKEPEKFQELYKKDETVFQHIQRKGILRINEDPTVDAGKRGDIKGQGFLERQKRYLEKSKNPWMDKKQITAIIHAKEKFQNASIHSLENIRELVRLGANLHGLEDYDGNTPLHVLSRQRDAQSSDINAVVACGVDINARNRGSRTALSLAVEKNTCEYTEALLSYLPSRDAMDSEPLLVSAMYNANPEIMISLLLKTYPDLIEQKDINDRWTPIMHALARPSVPNRPEIVKLLLASGANSNAKARSVFPVEYNGIEYKENVSVLEIAELVDRAAKPGEALFTPTIKRARGLAVSADEPEIQPAMAPSSSIGVPMTPEKKLDETSNKQETYKHTLEDLRKKSQEPKKSPPDSIGSTEIHGRYGRH